MESVILEKKNKVAILTLNEPNSLNALSTTIKHDLIKKVEMIEQDNEVEIVIISGSGRAFCAGGDVKGMGKRTAIESYSKINKTTEIIKIIYNMSKPVIAAVGGYAMGAGFSLALAADIIIANHKTKFGLSFAKIGLLPDCGLLYLLPKVVGPWKAKEWIFNGSIINAEEAYQYGIINQLVDGEKNVVNFAIEYAESLSASAIQPMKFTKQILNGNLNQSLDAAIQYENTAQTILQQTDDYREGVQAFKEKREPIFKGK